MPKKTIFLLVFLFMFCVSAQAATWVPPDLTWETIETPHFKIHYSTDIKEIALDFAPVAEQIHDRLTKFYEHEVEMKTNVVLLDTTDFGNGWAQVIGDPTIVLYVSPLVSNANPYKYEYWFKFVFTHEYSHILTLDYTPSDLQGARWLTGRMMFPNLLLPMYMVEGLAVYTETYFGKGGRAVDPRWQAMMRMDILEDNIRPPDQVAQRIPEWPGGSLMYLYGGEFLEYIANTYGIEKYIELEQNYGFYVLSGKGLNDDFKATLGKGFYQVWDDWLASLKEKYKKEKAKVEAEGIKEGQRRTFTGYQNFKPKWGGDSKTIYYLSNSSRHYSQIRKLDSETGQDEEECEALVGSENFSFDKASKNLVVSKAGFYDTLYLKRDLFVYNLENKKWFRLTGKERATDPAVSPDNKTIAYVQMNKGQRNLKFIKIKENDEVEITETVIEGDYFSPAWSPDGKKIVVSKKEKDGNFILYQISYPSLEAEPLFAVSSFLEVANTNPCFSPDGKLVLFDSDVSGIVNLYAYSLDSGRIYQLTNVIGGAMMPAVSPDNAKLAYVSYSKDGYDISTMPFAPENWDLVEFNQTITDSGTKEYLAIDYGKRPKDLRIHKYEAWPAAFPKYWIPAFYLSNYGSYVYFYTAGWDPLRWNQLQLAFSYDSAAGRPAYSLLYSNDQFWPQISLLMNDNAVPYLSTNNSLTWRREITQGIYTTFYQRPIFRETDVQALSFGYEQHFGQEVLNSQSYALSTDWRKLAGPVFMWSYAGARSYGYSISKEDGLDFNFTAKAFSPRYGSQYDFYQQLLSADWYLPVPKTYHNVLALRFYGFTSSGNDLDSGKLYATTVPIRGYTLGSVAGFKGQMKTAEYRFPIWHINRGTADGITFYKYLWAKLFYEEGGATTLFTGNLNVCRASGFEFTLDMILSNLFYPQITIGYAEGWDQGGQKQFYFSLGF